MLTKISVGVFAIPACMALAAPVETLVERDDGSSMTLWYTDGYESQYYTMIRDDTCLRPVGGLWTDNRDNPTFDLKPTNVYGHTDCTYTVNNDALLNNAAGVLNCPGGPTNIQCRDVPGFGSGRGPADNDCKPKTNGQPHTGWVANAICKW